MHESHIYKIINTQIYILYIIYTSKYPHWQVKVVIWSRKLNEIFTVGVMCDVSSVAMFSELIIKFNANHKPNACSRIYLIKIAHLTTYTL